MVFVSGRPFIPSTGRPKPDDAVVIPTLNGACDLLRQGHRSDGTTLTCTDPAELFHSVSMHREWSSQCGTVVLVREASHRAMQPHRRRAALVKSLAGYGHAPTGWQVYQLVWLDKLGAAESSPVLMAHQSAVALTGPEGVCGKGNSLRHTIQG